MKPDELKKAVCEHNGEFLCERIRDRHDKKTVQFHHLVTAPTQEGEIPSFGKLRDFYQTFGSALFYHDPKSGEAAKHLAAISHWPELHDSFSGWIENLSDEEREEILPAWIDGCLVIGETPRSGNYILMPTVGPQRGRVFEFDHDGFEFTDAASDLIEYVQKLLRPDGSRLTEFASHMRFIEGDPQIQWWIRELKDNRGHVATT